MSLYSADNFIEKSKMLGIDLSEEQIEKFMDYYELLVEWNSFMNLTAITDFEEVVLKHFVDSLAIYQIEVFRKNLNSSLIDVDRSRISRNSVEDHVSGTEDHTVGFLK